MHYSRKSPYLAAIKERTILSREGSSKDTQHIVLDIKDSGIDYQPGDCVGILPSNSPELVEKTLKALNANADEAIEIAGNELSLQHFLCYQANLSKVDKRLVESLVPKNPQLEPLLEKEELEDFLHERELWDFLKEYQIKEIKLQELCAALKPICPRYYSIASSKKAVGEEIHLTIANIRFESNGKLRYGLATHYLCDQVPLNKPQVPIFIHPARHFRLPEDPSKDIIMVGPGTGIAPFRAFMQERLYHKAKGKHWLFFGDRQKEYDFLYQDYWKALQETGDLRLDLAFSRDQDEKVYVQDRMLQHAKDLWLFLENGAYFYVCGDAKQMAKSVDQALLTIVEEQGKMSSEKAKDYVQTLKKEKRYLRDVY